MSWLTGYLAALILVGATVGPTGTAPLWLAATLPLALVLSPHLRERRLLGAWIVGAGSAAAGLWQLSSAMASPQYYWTVGAFAGALWFAWEARKDARLARWLASLGLLMLLVAFFSSGKGGADPMVRWYLGLGLTDRQAHLLTVAFRKVVHFTFYGSIAWTSLRAAREAGAGRAEAVRSALLAALSVSVFDEARQSSYANRSGSAWDVALDLVGGLAFVGLSEARRAKAR